MIKYNIHHVKGLYFQITEDEGKNREYEVSFVDRSDNKEIYKTKAKKNDKIRIYKLCA